LVQNRKNLIFAAKIANFQRISKFFKIFLLLPTIPLSLEIEIEIQDGGANQLNRFLLKNRHLKNHLNLCHICRNAGKLSKK
jgi:hypothetical protein